MNDMWASDDEDLCVVPVSVIQPVEQPQEGEGQEEEAEGRRGGAAVARAEMLTPS